MVSSCFAVLGPHLQEPCIFQTFYFQEKELLGNYIVDDILTTSHSGAHWISIQSPILIGNRIAELVDSTVPPVHKVITVRCMNIYCT